VRRYVWMVRAGFLLVAGALGIGAVEARQKDESFFRGVNGVTGQRQPTAARLRAELSSVKAQGNAAGLRLGLRTCVSNGPAGAPRF
jgi:hypothetical protein